MFNLFSRPQKSQSDLSDPDILWAYPLARFADKQEPFAAFALGQRVFHQKFGYGTISDIDGNKLTVEFEKAGQKKVVASFVEAV